MTALDLGAATRTLTIPSASFSTVAFGDQTLAITLGPDPCPVDTFEGFDAIPLYPTEDLNLETAGPASAPSTAHHALFVAVADLASLIALSDGNGVGFGAPTETTISLLGDGNISAGVGASTFVDSSALSLLEGVNVIGVVGNSSDIILASLEDGVLGTITNDGVPSGFYAGFSGYGGGNPLLLGMWEFVDLEVDETTLLDTLAAIGALFAPYPIEAIGVGEFIGEIIEITATTIEEGEEVETAYDPPVIEPPTSGGGQEAPDVPPFVIPDGVEEAQVWHTAEEMPEPEFEQYWPVDWRATDAIQEELGDIQIIVEGVDITWVNGIRTPVPQWSAAEPFGYQQARIDLPQITPFHALPAWAMKNANVEIRFVFNAEHGGGFVRLFVGVLFDTSNQGEAGDFGLDCIGLLFVGDYQLRAPAFDTKPLDIGTAIPRVMNGIIGRRHGTMATVTTGIKTGVAGGWEPILTGFVQGILATALKDGRQWTVSCPNRTPILEKKDTTTVDWGFRFGQRGIVADLHSDTSEQTNVIFGQGINTDGGHWRNCRYPNWHPDDTPPYPNSDPDDTHTVGARDSHTDTGRGISDWERKAGLPVNGYLSQSDVAEMKRIQRRAGIQVDGWLGPQTWAATFNTGANTGTLDGAFIAPLAAASEVMPRLYGPDGDDLGPNPDFDPNIIRIERHINFGQGVSRAQGRNAAEEIVARDSKEGVYGTITLTADPMAKSRLLIQPGENTEVLGWRAQDLLLHVADVNHNEESTTLTVDSKARDIVTLDAIMVRDREAQDPALLARKRLLHGMIDVDRPEYDAEGPGGRVPRHALFHDLWSVRMIPMGSHGYVSRTSLTTSDSASPFSCAIFGKPVTAADLVSVVGNPLTTSANESPWERYGDELEDMGLLQAYGWAKQPVGYFPRSYSNPAGTGHGAPVTGRHVDYSSWEYASAKSPYLWIATIAAESCYFQARLYGAPK